MSDQTHKREEIALGLAIAGLGAVFLWAAMKIPSGNTLVGARSVPAIAAGLLVAGGLAVAALGWAGRILPAPKKDVQRKLPTIVLPSVALAGIFLWLWSALGWTLASLIIAPAFFAIFGARGWVEMVLYPAIAVAILYIIFYQILGLWHGTGWLVERLGLA